jgi:hypothetical protein
MQRRRVSLLPDSLKGRSRKRSRHTRAVVVSTQKRIYVFLEIDTDDGASVVAQVSPHLRKQGLRLDRVQIPHRRAWEKSRPAAAGAIKRKLKYIQEIALDGRTQSDGKREAILFDVSARRASAISIGT